MVASDVVFVLVHEDRHFGVEVVVYENRNEAVQEAQKIVREAASRYDRPPVTDQNIREGDRVYYGNSYDDGPRATVYRKVVK